MKIHHFDEEYAKQQGLSGIKEFLSAIIILLISTIIPAILFGCGIISGTIFLIIIVVAIIITFYLIKKYGIINKSTMSVLIEDNNELYYMMITPDLRGSMFPNTFLDLLANSSETYVTNKLYAEMVAHDIANNDEIVKLLFDLYGKDEIKTTFDTIMYGKPIYVFKIIDKNFEAKNKKMYKVNCIKNNKVKSKVIIPKVFPTFFN